MRKKLLVLMVIAISLGGAFFILSSLLGANFINFANTPNYVLKKQKPKATIGKTEVFVDTARTSSEKEKGLSGKKSLQENEGMLFIWDESTTPGFWMKDMNFAIDIIWIREERIVGIEENVQPEPGKKDNELTRYYPSEPITHVLEVKAGFSKVYNIMTGDRVNLPTSSF
jgi:uncharacterized membrane protein (UPF0127 family)